MDTFPWIMSKTMLSPISDSIWIASPRQRVFAALTEASELKSWWPKDAISDARLTGQIELIWSKEPLNHMVSHFDVFDPGIELGYPFYSEYLCFSLQDEDAGTVVQIHHHCEADAAIHVAQSWGFLKANLKTWVEHGLDLRRA